MVCEAVDQCLNSSKIPKDLKQEAQGISCAVQSIVEEEDKEEIICTFNAASLFKKSYLKEMMKEQQKDPIPKLVYQQVTA